MGGEGFDFLGFHFRRVGASRTSGRPYIACWPSQSGDGGGPAADAGNSPRWGGSACRPSWSWQDLNRFLRGWGGLLSLRELNRTVPRPRPLRVLAAGAFHDAASTTDPETGRGAFELLESRDRLGLHRLTGTIGHDHAHASRRTMSESRVRENLTHGSKRRREETRPVGLTSPQGGNAPPADPTPARLPRPRPQGPARPAGALIRPIFDAASGEEASSGSARRSRSSRGRLPRSPRCSRTPRPTSSPSTRSRPTHWRKLRSHQPARALQQRDRPAHRRRRHLPRRPRADPARRRCSASSRTTVMKDGGPR